MEIEGNLSKKARYAVARNRYAKYRNRRKGSKVYLAVLFAMCEGRCPCCDRNMLLSFDKELNEKGNAATLDHTIPLVKELKHTKYGLEIMCKDCNAKKGNSLPS